MNGLVAPLNEHKKDEKLSSKVKLSNQEGSKGVNGAIIGDSKPDLPISQGPWAIKGSSSVLTDKKALLYISMMLTKGY